MFQEINQHHLIKAYYSSAKGWLQQTANDWQSAAKEFELLGLRVIRPDVQAAQAFCQAQAARKEEIPEHALTYLNHAAQLLPDWPLVPEALGEIYRSLGRRVEAETQLNHALKLDNQLIHARLSYATHLCERNNYKAAEDVLKLGLKQHPKESAFHCLLGHIALSDRRLESAERRYQRAVIIDDSDADAYTGLSSVRMLAGRYEDALDYIRLALHYNQRHSVALVNRGMIRLYLDQRGEAEADFERATRIAPRAAHNYFRIASFYWQVEEEPFQAERYLRLAINCESARSEYHTLLGMIYFETSKLAEAEKYWRQALMLNPEDILALHGLAVLAILSKDQETAQRFLTRAASLLLTSRRYLIGKLNAQLHPLLRPSSIE